MRLIERTIAVAGCVALATHGDVLNDIFAAGDFGVITGPVRLRFGCAFRMADGGEEKAGAC